jgi:hypothetical protein
MEIFEDINDLIFVLKEIVNIVYENWNTVQYGMSKFVLKNLQQTYKKRNIKLFNELPVNLNFENLLVSCKYLISILGVLYNDYIKDNNNLIKSSYDNCKIKDCLDMIRWWKKNMSIRAVYNKDTILYIWNSDLKQHKKIKLINYISQDEIEQLNNMNPTISEHQIEELCYKHKLFN